MLGLGLAASSAAPVFLPKDDWQKLYSKVSPEVVDLQPFMGKGETVELAQSYVERLNSAFNTLRAQIEDYRPDAIIVVGADRGEMFSRINIPTFSIYTGKEAPAAQGVLDLPETIKGTVTIPCDSGLANVLLDGLVSREFEMSWGSEFKPVGNKGNYLSHSIAAPIQRLVPKLNIPIIPLFINVYSPPLPSAQRCWDLGLAIREAMAERPEKIAILASGGLSYDPAARWVDEPFDRWILDNLQGGKPEKLKRLFTFDSENLRGPTGEIRAWITVAATSQSKAKVVDYIPARQTKTGLAFAYWPPTR